MNKRLEVFEVYLDAYRRSHETRDGLVAAYCFRSSRICSHTTNHPIIFSDGEWELPSAGWHSAELLAWLYNESPVKDEMVVDDRWGSDTRQKYGGYWTTEYTPGMSGVEHPWESRGMGVSYGYNRAEDLKIYHSGRELNCGCRCSPGSEKDLAPNAY